MANLRRLCFNDKCSDIPETYTKTEIDNLIASLDIVRFEIVEQLPSEGENNVIYLLPNDDTNPNVYDEYIWVYDPDTDTGIFELIGNTEIDLSDYATKQYVNNLELVTHIGNNGVGLALKNKNTQEVQGYIKFMSSSDEMRVYKSDNSLDFDLSPLVNAINAKQDRLTAGPNITIDSNNVISATGSMTKEEILSTLGYQEETMKLTDENGNIVTKIILVQEPAPPTFTGLTNVTVYTMEFDPRFGVTAKDYNGQRINYTVSGTVDACVAGTYTLTYSATDSLGQTTTQTRTITVEKTTGDMVYAQYVFLDTGQSTSLIINTGALDVREGDVIHFEMAGYTGVNGSSNESAVTCMGSYTVTTSDILNSRIWIDAGNDIVIVLAMIANEYCSDVRDVYDIEIKNNMDSSFVKVVFDSVRIWRT